MAKDAFEIARSAAERACPDITHYKHSSVILDRKGRKISVGRNYYAGRVVMTEEGLMRKSVHSEIHALSQVNIRRLSGATIINYARTNARTNLAKPCPNCWAVLKKLGFKKVIYSVISPLELPKWEEAYF